MSGWAALPRVWWFPPIDTLWREGEDHGTYWAFPLDDQPSIGAAAHEDLRWLEQQPEAIEWGLDGVEASPIRRVDPEALDALVPQGGAAEALRVLANNPRLQRRIRSFTGCYLDLGDFAVPSDEGALLLHFLSDQQWIRHWIVLLNPDGSESVLSSRAPIGFDLSASRDEPQLPSIISTDGSIDLSVAADSLEEFLYRFWIENEIAFRMVEHQHLTEPMATYADSFA